MLIQAYAAQRYSASTREIAIQIKDALNEDALLDAAEAMADALRTVHMSGPCVLVPAPSSRVHGGTSTIVLAEFIAKLVPGAVVVSAVLREHDVLSSVLARRMLARGQQVQPPTLSQHIASMSRSDVVLPKGPIFIVDNVWTTGNTAHAVAHHLERDCAALVYVGSGDDVTYAVRKNPMLVEDFIICVSGSRTFRHLEFVDAYLNTIPVLVREHVIILHGGAVGVDSRADYAARRLGFAVEVVRPDWERWGPSAGPRRNREMVDRADFLVAFWDGKSRGTASAIKAALDRGKDLEVLRDVL
jgi:hypothetical protein